ncbi:hypothetical protein ACFVFQ_10240 [Streptomyces sp. NPDC057743]|uniref:hypothetical protein n=1 Tax=Streptomyces sp. NPDC057743 TaxID=3346236 RepID=UPI0036CBDDB7
MQDSDGPQRWHRRIPFGAIGLALAFIVSIAGITWAVDLDETGVEVAPPSADTHHPAGSPAPPALPLAPGPHAISSASHGM